MIEQWAALPGAGGWNLMVLGVPLNPSHAVILRKLMKNHPTMTKKQPHEDKTPWKPISRRPKLMETTPKDKNPWKPTPRRQRAHENPQEPTPRRQNPTDKAEYLHSEAHCSDSRWLNPSAAPFFQALMKSQFQPRCGGNALQGETGGNVLFST